MMIILQDVIKKIKNNLFKGKTIALFLLSIIFTIIYLLLDDTNFSGINKIQQILRDELIKKEVEEKVNLENFANMNREIEKETAIDKTKDEVEDSIKEDELDPSKIDQPIYQKIFNRLYFSITTGCLLGYGDIYPISNIAKFISMLQSLLTVTLILS
jgi:hypothetical protein